MATRRIEIYHRVEQALETGAQRLSELQEEDGSFDLGFDGGALPDAHFVFIDRMLELELEDHSERLVRRLLDRQLAEGSWALAPGMGGHLATTVEAYVALRAAGLGADERSLKRARRYILESGGLGNVRGPSRVTLALVGLVPWAELNIPPPELALLPALAPVSLFRVGAPLRLHLLPLLVLRAVEALPAPRLGRALGAELKAKPLFSKGRPPSLRRPMRSKALTACLDLMVERLDDDGTLGGLLMATGWAAVAARVMGMDSENPLFKETPRGLRSLVYGSRGRDVHVQVCRPTVRSTALGLRALRAVGREDDATERCTSYLLDRRAEERGDFEILGPPGPAVAWSIKPRSRRFPSLLDTTAVVAAVSGSDGAERIEANALRWVASMQRSDGGFAYFDRHAATAPWLSKLPLGLLCHTLNDESSPEVTGRVLEIGCRRGALTKQQIDRAVAFLGKRQGSDGSWLGPFSVGHLPATSAALLGLSAARQQRSKAVERGVSFLVQHQRTDGGWGESPESMAQGRYVDLGRSMATQTAMALRGLLASGASTRGGAVERALWFLLWSQEPDGSWVEDDPCSASLAEVVHLRDPIDSHAQPLLALSEYLARVSPKDASEIAHLVRSRAKR